MYGLIIYEYTPTNKFYTFKTSSPYKFDKMLTSLRKNVKIKLHKIESLWN